MPHAKSCCETMDEFVALHQVQLLSSNVPEHLWESLYLKLKLEVHTLPDCWQQQTPRNSCIDLCCPKQKVNYGTNLKIICVFFE